MEAVWALEISPKPVIVCKALAGWLDSTVRWVSFYSAH
jgi:hypothetical protein